MRHAAAMALAVVLISGCVADGNDDGVRIVLTDDGCTYEGDTSMAAGRLSLGVENASASAGGFALHVIPAGRTFAELESYIDAENARLGGRSEPLGPPAFSPIVARRVVAAGGEGTLSADAAPGAYAVVCYFDRLLTELFLLPELDIGE